MYEKLYEENKGLLVAMARRYARMCALDRAVSQEDLTQAGFIGLAKAAQSYNAQEGKSWAGWAAWHIQREFESALGLREGRITRAHTGADTLDRRLETEDGESAALGDLLADERLPDPEAALLLEELRQTVRQAVNGLENDGQRRIVQLCRLEGRSYREAAEAMGISVQRARRLGDRATQRLARDRRLRRLADLDERTRFHAHKGVAAFNRDWTSVTEGAALWRIEQQASPQGTQNA